MQYYSHKGLILQYTKQGQNKFHSTAEKSATEPLQYNCERLFLVIRSAASLKVLLSNNNKKQNAKLFRFIICLIYLSKFKALLFYLKIINIPY